MPRLVRLIATLALMLHALVAWAQQGTRFPQDFNGLWWIPAESGWGVGLFNPEGNTLTSMVFAYGPDGSPTWYIAPNVANCIPNFATTVSVSCSGTVYQTMGPWFGAGPFNPANVSIRNVGDWSGTLSGPLAGSTGSRELDLQLTIDGETLKKSLVLQDIAGSSTLNFSSADSKFTDLWWNPDESGWGVGVFQFKSFAFAILFVYGVNHQPTWYVASVVETTPAGDTSQRSFEGPVFATTGTWWYTSPFKLTSVRIAGMARFVFPSDGINASLSYTVDGHTVQTVIRRTSQP